MKNRIGICLLSFLLVAFVLTTGSYAQNSMAVQDQVTADNTQIDLTSSGDLPVEKFGRQDGDNLPSPQAMEQYQRRQEALKQRLAGKGSGKIHEVAKGQYVELQLERTDHIFAVIVEYGNSAGTGLSTTAGPLHNQIPEPNRATDNNTIWQADYSHGHFQDLYSVQMADYYKAQSSGRYTVDGQVTDWVKVPFNGSRYGANAMGDAGAWTLIADAINTWTAAQLASGKTIEEVKAYLQQFDKWDRYDYDKDGNFDEPDGYIDHFQIIHSGAGEETGGGTLGADAIWSHRWFAFYNWRTVAGPAYNKYGGLEFGGGWGANPSGTTSGSSGASVGPTRANVTNAYPVTPTGIFVGDYTIQPENGGLGVFAHEFGHDLGLPDHYDTSSGGSNGNSFWNIMANGSYLGDGTVDIGSRPGDLMGWDKLQLGWFNYEIAKPGKLSSIKLGPAETNTKQAQGLVVILPPEKNGYYVFNAVSGAPFGTKMYWGGKGDLIDNSMTRQVAVPAGTPVLTMKLNYAIEANWDYAYVMVSSDNGVSWAFLQGTYVNTSGQTVAITTCANPNASTAFVTGACGITGTSGNAWRLASFNMTAYAGQTVLLGLRYKTDAFTNLAGVMVDDITLGTLTDGAEGDTSAWTFAGFKATTGYENSNAPHYYLAEYRQYRNYDKGLQTGPYTFGFADLPNYVAHYPYEAGLLVTYWDTDTANDNTSVHPGEGRCLPVDAHPDPLIRTGTWPDGSTLASAWTAPVQTHDATFGLHPTEPLHIPFVGTFSGQRLQFWFDSGSLPPVPVFNDMNNYWSPIANANLSSVIVPKTGTTIRVVSTSAQDSFMQVQVQAPK
jgi:immune inhibitor A